MTQTPEAKPPRNGGRQIHKADRQGQVVEANERSSSLFRIFECIRALHERGIEPTRDVIATRTNLPLTTVDDRIKILRNEGLISTHKQCYRPLVKHAPARPVSATVLGDGMVKIDVADTVLELTPVEAQALGVLTQGFAMENVTLGKVAFLEATVVKQSTEIRKLRDQLDNVVDVQAREIRQPRLI